MTEKEFTRKLMQFKKTGKSASWIRKEFSDFEEAYYYISELEKAKTGKSSIYNGKIIHNQDENTFAIVDQFSCYLKYDYDRFNEIFSEIENCDAQRVSEEKILSQFLININNKEFFIKSLKKEFKSEKGLKIRYMIEGLKKLSLISFGDRENTALYKSIEKSFDWNIGSKQGIFDNKDVNPTNIEAAIARITPLISESNS